GRAFGELDPASPANAIINDIAFAKDPDGKVRYVTTFILTKPVDAARASGLMWHEVPNRGMRRPNVVAERGFGDIDVHSAWQGDNAGATAVRPTAAVSQPLWLKVPIARKADGTPITGDVLGRIVNRSGLGSQPLIVPPNPTQICLKNGFDAAKLYQVVYTSADAYALGVGFAAWRDLGVFFKTARADDTGTPNPVAGLVTHSIGRGVSQSGNFLRGWLHLGFNRDENGKQVHDGLWPIIAGRRIAL